MEDSVLHLANTLTADNNDVDFEVNDAKNVKVRFRKTSPTELVRDPIDTGDVSIQLPDSLAVKSSAGSSLLLKVLVYESSPYVLANHPDSGEQAGSIVVTRMENEHGHEQTVDENDPLQLSVNLPQSRSTPEPLPDDSVWCLTRQDGQILVARWSVPGGRTLALTGRMEEEPTDAVFDFAAVVTSSGVRVTHTYDDVSVVLTDGVAVLFVPGGSRVCVRGTYSESSTKRRRLLASSVSSTQQMSSSGVSAVVWDSATSTWQQNAGVQLSGVDGTGRVQFKANMFGTFSLTDMVVAPTPIDFADVFLNFQRYLQDSPYVLIVVCCLLVVTVIVIVVLRRLDKGDSALWEYLPLIDNQSTDPHLYTLSVHTALSSPRHVTATPFFVLKGRRGATDIRVLCDGVRENFGSGTVSNFILRCPRYLGSLTELRIWHDNKGDHPHWRLAKVVVLDRASENVTVFHCGDWLSTTKGDGRLSRHLPALTPDGKEGGGAVFSLVSKQRLFDDHLWLSMTRRPVYSTFTRVQRCVTAVALLFLSMVTNAMFYQGKEAEQTTVRGVEIGPVQLNYRQLFVGAVSSVIILIPALLITLSFKRRRLRGACCSPPISSPTPKRSRIVPTVMVTSESQQQLSENIASEDNGKIGSQHNSKDSGPFEMLSLEEYPREKRTLGETHVSSCSSSVSSQETLASFVEPDSSCCVVHGEKHHSGESDGKSHSQTPESRCEETEFTTPGQDDSINSTCPDSLLDPLSTHANREEPADEGDQRIEDSPQRVQKPFKEDTSSS
ncbi:uncharacterized protein LOC143275024 [Babylonia areolata]|uniref:uncharacterized protein LOC143275024 n=1 Tax=Babylonia areolata TaxID=304850 RepID=UPI003FD62BD0